jgi:CHAT domain-containing protein
MVKSDAAGISAARAGESRASVEYLFALQRVQDFKGCQALAQQLDVRDKNGPYARYPWIVAQAEVTEKVCDDTPETRVAGRAQAMAALQLSENSRYRLMTSRIHLMQSGDALDSGDDETGERMVMTTLRELYAADPPPIRIANTVGSLTEVEQDSPLTHRNERSILETVKWFELAGSPAFAAILRMDLVRAEIRIGAMQEAEKQLRLAHQEGNALGKASRNYFTETDVLLASSMLEKGNLSQVAFYLDEATEGMKNRTDDWMLRPYVATRGMFELKLGNFARADSILESYLRDSEGKDVRHGDRATAAEFAQKDRELYAELAATWLAMGRSPESVLALWERFRLRSRGLPITQCEGGALDCEEPRLLAARRNLNGNLLIGQILLLDRVLVYRADSDKVTWTSVPRQRQDLLDAAMTLERAVSSPLTSTETAEQLGARLSDALLPPLPANLGPHAFLILEPDPQLANLSWPVLPTPSGPLGLQYPLAEMRSILTVVPAHKENGLESSATPADRSRSLVIGASEANDETPLPEVLDEAKTISGFLHAPHLLLGDQANVPHVAQLLDSATVFHFAGHAVQTSHGTELLLAASSPGDKHPWIDGAFLRQHPPRACRLAVLSACATGVREASWNHPLQDIVETLGSVGVPEVVATRWQISSESAVPFMEAFYLSMAQGSDVAMALTSARRLQSLQAHENSPFYWGAYYVSCTESVGRRKISHVPQSIQAKEK